MSAGGDGGSEVAGAAEFEPPLGRVPNFTFGHPVLASASVKWRANGGYNRLLAILKDGDNVHAFRKLLRFTAAMAGLPLLTLLVSYHLLLERFFTFRDKSDKMVFAGIAAIASVQLVICAFVVSAFREPAVETKKND